MAFERERDQSLMVVALAASTASILEFYFPNPARIKRYWAVPSVAEPAHATQTLDVVFVDAGTAGAGAVALATLTNNSGQANTTIRKSAAWVAHDALEINAEARPVSAFATDVADSIAAGEVVKCTVTKGAGTATGNVIVGLEYVPST